MNTTPTPDRCERCENHDPRDRRDHGHVPREWQAARVSSIKLLRQYNDQYGGRRPAADVALIGQLYAHEAHGPADSLYGRCAVCGMTWEGQARAASLIAR